MSKPDIWRPVYIGHYLASAMHLAWKKDGAVSRTPRERSRGMAPKRAGAGLFPECSREFICIAGRVWREYGKARTKAQAFDIRGFPLRWEMMGSQEHRSALSRFFRLFNGNPME
jgi:hypothetical protein